MIPTAIETEFMGYKFRSRLEARRAFFFDRLGWKFQYEVEGFDLGELGWYLPDFFIADQKLFIEVKPPSNFPDLFNYDTICAEGILALLTSAEPHGLREFIETELGPHPEISKVRRLTERGVDSAVVYCDPVDALSPRSGSLAFYGDGGFTSFSRLNSVGSEEAGRAARESRQHRF